MVRGGQGGSLAKKRVLPEDPMIPFDLEGIFQTDVSPFTAKREPWAAEQKKVERRL